MISQEAWRLIRAVMKATRGGKITEVNIIKRGIKISAKKIPQSNSPQNSSSPPKILAADAEVKVGNQVEIRSDHVGIIFLLPAPDADPFIRVGSQIKSGQPLCQIDVLGIKQDVIAEVSGKVTEIHIKHHDSVEFDQLLITIQPNENLEESN